MSKNLKRTVASFLIIFIISYIIIGNIFTIKVYATDNDDFVGPLLPGNTNSDNETNNERQSESTPRTGHTQVEAGETIAAWCIDFWNKHKDQCKYYGGNGYDEVRNRTLTMAVSDNDKSSTYTFDCVGFTAFALYHALGFGQDACPAVPPSNDPWGAYWRELHPENKVVGRGEYKGLQIPMDKIQPGDIIIMQHHVAIYVGDGKSIGMWRDRLYYGSAQEDCTLNGGYSGYVARVNPIAAKEANFKYLAGAISGDEGFSMKGTKVSDCSHNENNSENGGEPGDQTGKEYSVAEWYDFGQKYVLRHPDKDIAKEIAQVSIKSANNDAIGYSQDNRQTYFEQLEKNNYKPELITTKCEADCASSTVANIIAVGHLKNDNKLKGLDPNIFTGNMKEELEKVGFKTLTDEKYLNGPEELIAGDIILNEEKHVDVFVGNGGNWDQNSNQQMKHNYEIDDITVDLDEQQFAFTGTPKTVMYLGNHNTGEWVVSAFSQFLYYLGGIIFNGIRISILGYVITVENAIDSAFKFLEKNQ